MAILLATAQETFADSHIEVLSFADECLNHTDLGLLEEALRTRGWVEGAEADDTLVDGLTWIGVSQFFYGGDSGGERVAAIHELKPKMARGLLRKKDIPQSKNRFFIRATDDGDEVLHLMWRQPWPELVEIECRASLLRASMAEIREQVGTLELPAFAPLALKELEVGKASLTLFNPTALQPLSPPDAIVTTYRTVRTEKVTP